LCASVAAVDAEAAVDEEAAAEEVWVDLLRVHPLRRLRQQQEDFTSGVLAPLRPGK